MFGLVGGSVGGMGRVWVGWVPTLAKVGSGDVYGSGDGDAHGDDDSVYYLFSL